jgi:hypothetical protein
MVVPVFLARDGYLGYEGVIPATSNIFSLLGVLSFSGFSHFVSFINPSCLELHKTKVQTPLYK